LKPVIKPIDHTKEFYTDENCFIIELSNTAYDEDLSIARARVKPGVSTRWHRLNGITERYCIISGSGLVEVGNLPPQNMTTGDVAIIPPMYRQRITNTGPDDLIFLAMCTPRFKNEAYEDIEDIQV